MASHITLDDWLAGTFPDLHDRSHGQSFLELIESRFSSPGFYVMDEPESALSFHGQLQLLRFIRDAVLAGSQFIIATHSPLLMRAFNARILLLDERGVTPTLDLEVVALWRRFLDAPERVLDVLYADE